MSHSMSVHIEKLMFWRGGNWVKHDQKGACLLRILYDQLLITADTKIIESLNMNGKIKGFYKEDILILVVSGGKEARKIKFQIKGDVSQCLATLGQHFPVVSHGSTSKSGVFRYRNLDDVLKTAIGALERHDAYPLTMPQNFNDFVKLCLLDPTFPQLVNETQKVLENDILK